MTRFYFDHQEKDGEISQRRRRDRVARRGSRPSRGRTGRGGMDQGPRFRIWDRTETGHQKRRSRPTLHRESIHRDQSHGDQEAVGEAEQVTNGHIVGLRPLPV